VAEELDTSWFDLKNYDALKAMSIEGWASALQARANIFEIYDYAILKGQDIASTQLQLMADELKDGYFEFDGMIDSYVNEDHTAERLTWHSFSTLSVGSLKNHEAWNMTENKYSSSEWIAFQKMRDEWQKPWEGDDKKEDIKDAAHAPYDFRFKQFLNRDYISSHAHVVINLDFPDEQIINDLKQWLTHYRKAAGYNVPKRLAHKRVFTQSSFDNWIKDGVIPYLDLVIVAKIEGKEITQNKLGKVIFPDEFDVDTEYRIRTITKPEAERLMEDSTRWSLMFQAAFEKVAR
jgi:uncharacterized protein DUF6387